MTNLLNIPDWKLLFSEAIKRLQVKSPKFFRVWQNINWIVAAIGFIPAVLSEFNIILPPNWVVVVSKIVAFAGAWGAVMTKLPIAKPATETVQQMEAKTLPFTEKKQIEQAIKKEADSFKPNNKTGL